MTFMSIAQSIAEQAEYLQRELHQANAELASARARAADLATQRDDARADLKLERDETARMNEKIEALSQVFHKHRAEIADLTKDRDHWQRRVKAVEDYAHALREQLDMSVSSPKPRGRSAPTTTSTGSTWTRPARSSASSRRSRSLGVRLG